MPSDELQGMTGITTQTSQDHIDIEIRIYREGARYGANMIAVGCCQRLPIEMSPQDLMALNRQLQEEMQCTAAGGMEEPAPAELEARLRPLAEAGRFAFKRVFGHHDALAAIEDLFAMSRRVSIEVTSEDCFLPWELLYPVSLDEPLSYEHFWGMNHTISQVIVQEARPGAFVSPVISFAQRPRLGLLTYCRLSGVMAKEIPFFEKLNEDGRITLFRLRPLDPEKKRDEFREFRDFWSNAFNLAHFACHASYEDPPDQSFILLSDEFPISLRDMEVYGIVIDNHPLIILNACETGNLNPLYTAHFAAAFLKYGARGVVVTECTVPDSFAADFAEQLYTHLLAGESLGESLLTTRRYFLEEHHNPSGLLYSMYAPPSIRLAKTGE
jgi:hypothetical protein